MKSTLTRSTLISLGLAGGLLAEEPAAPPAEAAPAAPAAPAEAAASKATTPAVEIEAPPAPKEEKPETEAKKASETKPEKKAEAKPKSKEAREKEREAKREERMKKEKEQLELQNSLDAAKLQRETAKLRAEITKLKVEKELMAERLAHAAQKRAVEDEAEAAKMATETKRLGREAAKAKARAELLASELKAVQAESGIEITRLQSQIQEIEMEKKRKDYANGDPIYLKKPLKKDGTLVISDRRIELNGVISTATADKITDRIHYYNNQNTEFPIFIVIDECPGGSVMAGYRILKAMEASDAPIHVVVKSFAASMAAAITTLAEESYAYPNAVLLHHQISATVFGRMNLTQQKEFFKESMRWWNRLASPIADKMGLTKEEFIAKMYEKSTSGDWSEFGSEAKKLKWVKHIVSGIDETSLRRNPDAKTQAAKTTTQRTSMEETLDEEGRPIMYLPRINPKDVYFLYNPDGYYRVR